MIAGIVIHTGEVYASSNELATVVEKGIL